MRAFIVEFIATLVLSVLIGTALAPKTPPWVTILAFATFLIVAFWIGIRWDRRRVARRNRRE